MTKDYAVLSLLVSPMNSNALINLIPRIFIVPDDNLFFSVSKPGLSPFFSFSILLMFFWIFLSEEILVTLDHLFSSHHP